jgi:hypothetical protein
LSGTNYAGGLDCVQVGQVRVDVLLCSPEGVLLEETGEATPLCTITIDLDSARAQKSQYPCYVKETS